jgi:GNAT superfamily N-acetyltransferase
MKLPLRYKNKPIYDEDMDEIDYELSDKAHSLAKKENLGITSDRELSIIIVDLIDNVVAASWISWDGENYEFDVVVDKEHQGNKLGSALIDAHIDIPYDYIDENPDATMVLHIVNDKMKKALEKRNFVVKEGLTKDSCLMEKNTSIDLKNKPTV